MKHYCRICGTHDLGEEDRYCAQCDREMNGAPISPIRAEPSCDAMRYTDGEVSERSDPRQYFDAPMFFYMVDDSPHPPSEEAFDWFRQVLNERLAQADRAFMVLISTGGDQVATIEAHPNDEEAPFQVFHPLLRPPEVWPEEWMPTEALDRAYERALDLHSPPLGIDINKDHE